MKDIEFKIERQEEGGVTVVGLEAEGVIGLGAARCRPGDHFVEAIGDGIATGRALAAWGQRYAERWSARSVSEAELAERRARRTQGAVALEVDAIYVVDFILVP